MNSASRWPVVQLSHRRSPLHTRIPTSSVGPRTVWPFYVISEIKTPETDMRQKYWGHSTLGLPFSFNSFHPSKDLQSLLFKCYNIFFFFTKTMIPFMNTAAHLTTYPDSNYVHSSTQKVNEEAIFHIIIVLSVIDRNKSMQYSSVAVIFLGSDLAPSLGWGQWEHPEVSLRCFR